MIEDRIYPVSPPRSDGEIIIKPTITNRSAASMNASNSRSGTEANQRPQGAIRRSRSPPRNDMGQITCDHIDCQDKPPVFRRPCEWNKHMDRHERPYKCHEVGCELNPGFTYSGGLLRHQREVHKMYLSTSKQPLYCPVSNCNRSHGTGFTRKENLEEHKRRRHVTEFPMRSSSSPSGTSTTAANHPHYQQSYSHQSTMPSSSASYRNQQNLINNNSHPVSTFPDTRKRKRTLPLQPDEEYEEEDEDEDEDDDVDEGEDEDEDEEDEYDNEPGYDNVVNNTRQKMNWPMHPRNSSSISSASPQNNHMQLIDRLRTEISQRDEVIRRQAVDIQRLQNIIRALPAQAVYGVMTSSVSAPTICAERQ